MRGKKKKQLTQEQKRQMKAYDKAIAKLVEDDFIAQFKPKM